jgi:hypothetical protein
MFDTYELLAIKWAVSTATRQLEIAREETTSDASAIKKTDNVLRTQKTLMEKIDKALAESYKKNLTVNVRS